MNDFVRHEPCPECGSKDNVAVYRDKEGHESKHCFGCGYTIKSKNYSVTEKEDMEEVEEVGTEDFITREEVSEIVQRTSKDCRGYRGISDSVKAFYGVRTEFDENGEVLATYYPVTTNYRMSGYKRRGHPKTFSAIGYVKIKSDLFGQYRYKDVTEGKTVLIVGGEADTEAAYQMLKDYSLMKGWEHEPVVVSAVVGEGSTAKQLANQYAFLNKFQKIIIGLDNDKAGKEATEKCIAKLPKGKVFVATWSKGKDPNEMLLKGEVKAFLNDYYSAKQYVPVGVLASTDIYQKMLEQSHQEKISLPPVFSKLSDMLGGGLSLNHIYTCSGVTGGGKTSLTNEMIYHWIFNSPHKVGVVSLELNASQYGEVLLSRHMKQKLAKLAPEEKIKLLKSDKVIGFAKELFEKDDGSPRFFLVDDRDSSFEQFRSVVEQMIISSGVKLVVIDPWTDIGIDGLSIDEQAVAMKWVKSMIKSHGCAFFLINHVRKSQSGQKDQSSGGMISESDIMGSSSVMKSSSANILLVRDKMAEDTVERNTTSLFLSKNRLLSETGPAGKIYYDADTHTLHDLDDWCNENGVTVDF